LREREREGDMGEGARNRTDVWATGEAYEPYVGRWSRLVAREFVGWLAVPEGGEWLDVGCGTGALTATILEMAAPVSVTGIDPSEGYAEFARDRVRDPRAHFDLGDARRLPYEGGKFDCAVSGLVLNFVSGPEQAVGELARVTKPGGVVAAYVWDYAGKMELMRYFWDAAVDLNPAALELDEGRRFPLCKPEALQALWEGAGLGAVEVREIDAPTHFRDFDDYWSPFLGGQGPAPGFAMSLSEEGRAELRELIRSRLPVEADGSIRLIARAWAVRGKKG
jgi:SAM-dependent methyltransferase